MTGSTHPRLAFASRSSLTSGRLIPGRPPSLYMDRFTRNYSVTVAAVAVIASVLMLCESPRVSRLDGPLSENAEVASYPYHFRVINLENGVAMTSTPRSGDFSAFRALAILYPELRNQPPDSAAMLDAQEGMGRIQSIAREIAMEADGVSRVIWKLDENWLHREGVDVNQL